MVTGGQETHIRSRTIHAPRARLVGLRVRMRMCGLELRMRLGLCLDLRVELRLRLRNRLVVGWRPTLRRVIRSQRIRIRIRNPGIRVRVQRNRVGRVGTGDWPGRLSRGVATRIPRPRILILNLVRVADGMVVALARQRRLGAAALHRNPGARSRRWFHRVNFLWGIIRRALSLSLSVTDGGREERE